MNQASESATESLPSNKELLEAMLSLRRTQAAVNRRASSLAEILVKKRAVPVSP